MYEGSRIEVQVCLKVAVNKRKGEPEPRGRGCGEEQHREAVSITREQVPGVQKPPQGVDTLGRSGFGHMEI